MSTSKHDDTSKKINNILKFCSYFLALILPVFTVTSMYFPFFSSKTFLFYAVVEVMTALWIYALIIDSSYRLSRKTLLYFIPLVGFVLWMSIAGVLAINPSLSFWSSLGRGTGLLTLYHCLAFAFIISSLIKHNGSNYIYKLMNWFVSGGFLLAVSVWFGDEGFKASSLLKDAAGGGLMGNSSMAAAYLLFILAFGLFLLSSKKRNISKWWISTEVTIILFSPLFINILGLFSGSGLLGSARGATLGIVIAVVSAFVLYLAFSKKKLFRIFGIVGVALGIVIFSVGWMQLTNPNTALHQKFIDAASNTRFIFATIAERAIVSRPLFGYGPENYPIVFQQNINPEMLLVKNNVEVWTDRAHSIYYDTLISGGYGAVALYALLLLSIIFAIYKLSRKEDFNHIQLSILGGLVIGYVIQNLFVFDSPLSLMIFFVLAAIVFSANDSLSEEKYVLKSVNPVIKSILGIVLVVVCSTSLIFFVFQPVAKVIAYNTSVNTAINPRSEQYDGLMGGSRIGEDWDVGGMAYGIYAYYNTNPVKIKNDKSILPNAILDLKALTKYLETVREKNTTDVRLDTSLVFLYNTLNYFSNNPYDEVLGKHLFSILDSAKTISPQNPGIYWCMAQVYLWKGDYKGVEDTYLKAIAIDPNISDSYILLLKFTRNIGDRQLFESTLKEAQKNIPNFTLQ